MSEQIDDILTQGDPWRVTDDMRLREVVLQTAVAARIAAMGTRRPRRRSTWIAPVAVGGVLALTAGAIMTDSLLNADLPIPISYTTDTGVTVSCTAQIQGGSYFSGRRDQVIEYYRTHDFEGIGQRVYDYALVLTGDAEATKGVLPQSSEWVPGPGDAVDDDHFAFSQSLVSFLLTDAVIDLGIPSQSGDMTLTSDCTGQLH